MVEIADVAYTIGFFVFVVGGMLYIVWKSLESDVHSPAVTGGDDAAE
jgi:uncharacterized ion transporter superfamily protein YfcC